MRSAVAAVVGGDDRGRLQFGGSRVRQLDRRGHGRQVVREAVPAQVAVSAEHFAARRAVVRFDVGVRQQVRLQVGPLVEASAAHRTLVRRLLQVKDLVHGQRARLAKPLAAFQALERFLLGVDVPADTRQTHEAVDIIIRSKADARGGGSNGGYCPTPHSHKINVLYAHEMYNILINN